MCSGFQRRRQPIKAVRSVPAACFSPSAALPGPGAYAQNNLSQGGAGFPLSRRSIPGQNPQRASPTSGSRDPQGHQIFALSPCKPDQGLKQGQAQGSSEAVASAERQAGYLRVCAPAGLLELS